MPTISRSNRPPTSNVLWWWYIFVKRFILFCSPGRVKNRQSAYFRLFYATVLYTAMITWGGESYFTGKVMAPCNGNMYKCVYITAPLFPHLISLERLSDIRRSWVQGQRPLRSGQRLRAGVRLLSRFRTNYVTALRSHYWCCAGGGEGVTLATKTLFLRTGGKDFSELHRSSVRIRFS